MKNLTVKLPHYFSDFFYIASPVLLPIGMKYSTCEYCGKPFYYLGKVLKNSEVKEWHRECRECGKKNVIRFQFVPSNDKKINSELLDKFLDISLEVFYKYKEKLDDISSYFAYLMKASSWDREEEVDKNETSEYEYEDEDKELLIDSSEIIKAILGEDSAESLENIKRKIIETELNSPLETKLQRAISKYFEPPQQSQNKMANEKEKTPPNSYREFIETFSRKLSDIYSEINSQEIDLDPFKFFSLQFLILLLVKTPYKDFNFIYQKLPKSLQNIVRVSRKLFVLSHLNCNLY